MSLEPEYRQYLSELAYTPDVDFEREQQDWDLLNTSALTVGLFLDFTADTACPNRLYFLSCLYLFAGDIARNHLLLRLEGEPRKYDAEDDTIYKTPVGPVSTIQQLNALLARAEQSPDVLLIKWARRVHDLYEDPTRYDYDDWAAGGFAYETDDVEEQRKMKVKRESLNRVV